MAPGAVRPTASVEVSVSVASSMHAVLVALPADAAGASGFDAATEPDAQPAPDEPPWVSVPASSAIPTLRVSSPADPVPASNRPGVPGVRGDLASNPASPWRRPRASRVAWLLVAATLVAIAAVARSHGTELAASPASRIVAVDHADASPVSGAGIVEPARAAAPEPAATTSPDPAVQAPGPPAHDAPGAARDRGSAVEADATARDATRPTIASPQAPAPRPDELPERRPIPESTHRAPSPKRLADAAPGPSTPRPSGSARPSFESVRKAFEAKNYPGAVVACSAMPVTSASAELCTRAACQAHDIANAQLWLALNSAPQIGRLVSYCHDLGMRVIQGPALDCAKDPLDCR